MKKLLLVIASFLVLSWGQTLRAQAFTFTSGQKTYTENFDGMGATGTTFIPGWTAVRYAGTGTIGQTLTIAVTAAGSSSGTVYNAGTVGAVERAFGALASGSTVPRFGASFANNTGASISDVSLTGIMEQWRSGSVNTVNEICAFEYSTDATDLLTGTWTPASNFDLVEKILTSVAAASLDGNLPENQTALSATLSGLNWIAGTNLWIRWSDINDGGSDGLYCIDNLSLTVTNAVPTITVTSPVTGYQWQQGSSHDISWTATGTNVNVMIEYTANASDVTPTWVTLNASIAASAGIWSSWDITAGQALSTDSKIRITDIPQTATGLSGIFSIIAAPAPVATFNPLASATGIDIASNITVTFDVPVRNLDNSEITDANVASLLTLTTTNALGTTVPFTATIDAAKKVITINPNADLLNEQLYYVAVAPVEGLSNNATVAQNITFTTAASLAPAISDVTITGTLPYHAGDLVTINWVSKNITDVKIEAWVPSENAWTEMFATTPSDGSETFTIPVDAQYSTEYKIRVTDVANAGVTAESSIFTIIAAINDVTITEVAPYYAGDQLKVNWTSFNVLMVKVDMYNPATATWMNLASNVTASDGSTLITLPAATAYGADYKVRVSDMASSASAESSIFTVIAVVNDLISLRAQPLNAIVKYTGIATVTFTQASRNQKYIQDATAAVLIDDPNPGFIGAYNVGEGITNIVGKMLAYRALIEFTPMSATGEHATGSVIVPEVRTLASLTTADQGKLVKIENFAFKTPNQWDAVTGLFVKSKNYDIDGQDNTLMVFRTAFGSVDYIGAPVPVGPISTICIVGQFDAQMQITARSWSDMTVPTVADFNATPTFILEGENVQFTDMSTNNPVSWEWSFVGGSPAASTEQNPLVTYPANGTYAVTLKATNASGGTNTVTKTDYISIGVVGISTLESAVSVYPNPTRDNLYISNPANEKLEITILSTLGKPVKWMQANQGVTSVDLSDLPKGIYMVKMLNKTTKKTQTKKVVVK